MRDNNNNSNGFQIVIFTAIAVLILSFVLINFDSITGANSSSDEYVSYLISDHVSVYDLAESLCNPGDNVWELVYELKAANNLESDTIVANSIIKIPASVIDTGTDIDSIFLCNSKN